MADARAEVADRVQAALVAVTGLAHVEHSSARVAPSRVPSVVHYLHGETEVADNPMVARVLNWGVSLYAPVMPATEDGNQLALDLLAAVVAALAGQRWALTGYHAPVAVVKSELVEMTDTILSYYLQVAVTLQPV